MLMGHEILMDSALYSFAALAAFKLTTRALLAACLFPFVKTVISKENICLYFDSQG
jgi:hypothetical protein